MKLTGSSFLHSLDYSRIAEAKGKMSTETEYRNETVLRIVNLFSVWYNRSI